MQKRERRSTAERENCEVVREEKKERGRHGKRNDNKEGLFVACERGRREKRVIENRERNTGGQREQ